MKKFLGHTIAMIHKHSHQYLKSLLSDLDIGLTDFRVLISLYDQEGVHQDHIARYTDFNKATITRSLRTLEERNWIRRETDPEDHRAYLVYLTTEGKDQQAHLKRSLTAWRDQLTEGIAREDLAVTQRTLDDILNNIKKGCEQHGE